jgi:hypothetical protein
MTEGQAGQTVPPDHPEPAPSHTPVGSWLILDGAAPNVGLNSGVDRPDIVTTEACSYPDPSRRWCGRGSLRSLLARLRAAWRGE